MAAREVTIRMYNVGFGDCFLVTVPTDGGLRRILFDCGSIAKADRSIDDVAAQVIADVTPPARRGRPRAESSPRIDVVVCTHRHKDHVSGFASEEWAKVDVGEVWMPWTEDPDDEAAAEIRDAQSRLALSLGAAIDKLRLAPGLSVERREELDVAGELAANAMSNEAAMDMLHSGFLPGSAAPRRFLASTDRAGKPTPRYETARLPGIKVHVLGPSRSKEIIQDMDPPAGKSYLQLVASGMDANGAPDPFGPEWWGEDAASSVLGHTERETIGSFSDGFASSIAATLESAVNGTSLMLILEVGKGVFLFPGDAQWGTWNAVLEQPSLKKLLKKVRFYKVGHHGSHNATPIEFVEDTIPQDLVAMVSTRKYGKWRIPLPKLVDELKARGSIALSNEPDGADKAVFTVNEEKNVIETRVAV